MAQTGKKRAVRTEYVCEACGYTSARWMGRCGGCGEWNTLVEQRAPSRKSDVRETRGIAQPVALGEVKAEAAERLPTGLAELDRVLGGGLVPGGVVLLGGDPGIGKSTLVAQAFASLASQGRDALYVTGEESAAQVAMRARRLATPGIEAVQILATTELEDVEASVAARAPEVMVVDSIQTVRAGGLESAPGTVAQLREVSSRLIDRAKSQSIALILIGHVTKEGVIAGPKVLEHLVDTVLSFEGDRAHAFRMVRATKNRFGPAQEVGVFEMVQDGLREVPDPSALFLAERPEQASGSLVVPTAEGSRPLLVEVQALVAPAAYGAARRVASGLDANRLAILLAVLERKAAIHVLDRDVFVSVAGGVRVSERATDLALALAVVSSLREKPVATELAAFGELGLAGEVRAVQRAPLRIAEAKKLGYRRIVVPRLNAEQLTKEERAGVELIGVRNLAEAIESALD